MRVRRESGVFLEKTCPDHGTFSAKIWDGEPDFDVWQRPKIATVPPHVGKPVAKGCPFDCGLCPDHRQRSCTIILEITNRCNLGCPFCYADARGMAGDDPPLTIIKKWYTIACKAGANSNIQLSGGEPTVRDDLAYIVAMGRKAGFDFIQINTNGLRLARDARLVRELKSAGLSSVFLQFDGTDDAIYRKLRGRDLFADKLAAVDACAKNQIGVVLVPTLVPGVNDHDIGNILNLALERSPTVRAVHFQPVSYFGRFPHPPDDAERLTLPQLMRRIETQSDGRFKATHFTPPGCENALCSFSASYLVMPDRSVKAVGGAGLGSCCPAPIKAESGAAGAIAFVARQWGAPQQASTGPQLDSDSCRCDSNGSMSLDAFLRRAKTHLLSISAMAFQDVWNLDLDRARDCCIHIMAPDTRLVPFCLYNLTGSTGKRLYRL